MPIRTKIATAIQLLSVIGALIPLSAIALITQDGNDNSADEWKQRLHAEQLEALQSGSEPPETLDIIAQQQTIPGEPSAPTTEAPRDTAQQSLPVPVTKSASSEPEPFRVYIPNPEALRGAISMPPATHASVMVLDQQLAQSKIPMDTETGAMSVSDGANASITLAAGETTAPLPTPLIPAATEAQPISEAPLTATSMFSPSEAASEPPPSLDPATRKTLKAIPSGLDSPAQGKTKHITIEHDSVAERQAAEDKAAATAKTTAKVVPATPAVTPTEGASSANANSTAIAAAIAAATSADNAAHTPETTPGAQAAPGTPASPGAPGLPEAQATPRPRADISMARKKTHYNINDDIEKAYNSLLAGDTETAVNHYSSALTHNPNNQEALFGLAATYQRAGQSEMARPAYSRLLQINPQHREALNNFLALVAEEAPQEALQELLTLQTRNPDFAGLKAQIAIVYQKIGQTDQAIDYMGHALGLAPENLAYRYNLAVLLDHNGKREDAAALYQQLIEASLRGQAIPGDLNRIQQRLTFLRSNKK